MFCSVLFCSGLSNFGRGSSKEHACVIISNSIHWLKRRSRLKVFLFFFFSSGGHLVQQSKTVCAILVEGHPRNIPVYLFENPSTG